MLKASEILVDNYGAVLSDASRSAIDGLAERKVYGRHSLILDAGQVSKCFYLLDEGMVRLFYYKDGRDVTEHFVADGELMYCIESLFLEQPTELLIEAIEDTALYEIDYVRFTGLCDSNVEIGRLGRRLLEIDLVISQRKADAWRFESAKEKYLRFLKDYPEAAKRASVSQIATYLFMTPETLSRVRAEI